MKQWLLKGLPSAALVILFLVALAAILAAADILTVDKDGTIMLRITGTGEVGLYPRSGDPASPVEGYLWYNGTKKTFKGYVGNTTVDFANPEWDGVEYGVDVTELATPAQGVNVSAGVIWVGGRRVPVPAQSNIAASAADGSNPRVDVLQVAAAGTASLKAGAAAADPQAPAPDAENTIVAYIWRPAGNNVIRSSADVANPSDGFLYGRNMILHQRLYGRALTNDLTSATTSDTTQPPTTELNGMAVRYYEPRDHDVFVSFEGKFNHNTQNAIIRLSTRDEGGVIGPTPATWQSAVFAANLPVSHSCQTFKHMTGGAHKINIAWSTSAGTAVAFYANRNLFVLVSKY